MDLLSDFEHIGPFADTLVADLRYVDHAVPAGHYLHKSSEIPDADHGAVEFISLFWFVSDVLDHGHGLFHSLRSGGGDKYRTIILDVYAGSGSVDYVIDNLASGTYQGAYFGRIYLD